MVIDLGQRFVAAFAVMALAATIAGCEQQRTGEGPAQRAGKEIDKAMEKAGRQIEKAGDRIQEAARGDRK